MHWQPWWIWLRVWLNWDCFDSLAKDMKCSCLFLLARFQSWLWIAFLSSDDLRRRLSWSGLWYGLFDNFKPWLPEALYLFRSPEKRSVWQLSCCIPTEIGNGCMFHYRSRMSPVFRTVVLEAFLFFLSWTRQKMGTRKQRSSVTLLIITVRRSGVSCGRTILIKTLLVGRKSVGVDIFDVEDTFPASLCASHPPCLFSHILITVPNEQAPM